MISGCICCYNALDCESITVLCKGAGECLCCIAEDCCAAGEESKGFGCPEKKEGEICRLACPCCVRGLKIPTVLCAGSGSCLCCYSVASFPFNEQYVPGFVCAVYGLQCAPECGCCKPPPYAGSLDKPKGGGGSPSSASMER
jgi:hypothetical protein